MKQTMVTFTSTIPDDLSKQLKEKARSLSVPKNKLIESALRLYLEHLERAEYIRSFKKSADDADIVHMAEEGMEDYLRQVEA